MKMGDSLFHDFLNLFFALFHKPFWSACGSANADGGNTFQLFGLDF